MKKYLIILFSALINFLNAEAQSWQWVKQGGSTTFDYVISTCTDVNGDIYAIGDFGYYFPSGGDMYFDTDTATASGVNQLFLIKYTSSGNVSWVKSIGGDNSNSGSCNNCESAYSLCYDAANNYLYMTGKLYGSATFGSTNLFGSGNMFLTKLDLNGNFIWAKLYGNVGVHPFANVSTDLSGNIYLSGVTDDSLDFDNIIIPSGNFWAKLDSDGNTQWAKIISLAATPNRLFVIGNEIYSLFRTVNDTISIDTSFIVSSTQNNIILTKFDTSANIQWHQLISSNATSNFMALADIDASNNIYISGFFKTDIDFGSTQLSSTNTGDYFLVKYNSNGNLIWAKKSNVTTSAGSETIATTPDGTTYISGGFTGTLSIGSCSISSVVNNEMFIAHYDSNGDCLGLIQFGEAENPRIAVDNSANVIAAAVFYNSTFNLGGTTLNNIGVRDIFIAKHDVINGVRDDKRTINNQLMIFANPNAGICNITIPNDLLHEQNLTLNIYNAAGKLIQKKNIEMNEDKISISLEAEAKGSYNVTLGNGNKSYNGTIIFE